MRTASQRLQAIAHPSERQYDTPHIHVDRRKGRMATAVTDCCPVVAVACSPRRVGHRLVPSVRERRAQHAHTQLAAARRGGWLRARRGRHSQYGKAL